MEKEEVELNKKKEKRNRRITEIIIGILLLIIATLGGCILFGQKSSKSDTPTQDMDTAQGTYVKPEEPMDRSKNVTLPGWGSFTIPKDTTEITQGFEFHNPEENFWYVDTISINGKDVEDLVVDSGNKVELNHYLKLANINKSVKEVSAYNSDLFDIEQNEDGNYTVEAINFFTEGKQTIEVVLDDGSTQLIDVTSRSDCYYMTFTLCLSDNDEVLYQSGLVAPGNYIQKMELNKALEAGSYDAYVLIQPYKSDKKTVTNSGRVNITLNVA